MINAHGNGQSTKNTSTEKIILTDWKKRPTKQGKELLNGMKWKKTEECGFRLILTLSVFYAVFERVQWSAQMVLDLFCCIAAQYSHQYHFVLVFPLLDRQFFLSFASSITLSISHFFLHFFVIEDVQADFYQLFAYFLDFLCNFLKPVIFKRVNQIEVEKK